MIQLAVDETELLESVNVEVIQMVVDETEPLESVNVEVIQLAVDETESLESVNVEVIQLQGRQLQLPNLQDYFVCSMVLMEKNMGQQGWEILSMMSFQSTTQNFLNLGIQTLLHFQNQSITF